MHFLQTIQRHPEIEKSDKVKGRKKMPVMGNTEDYGKCLQQWFSKSILAQESFSKGHLYGNPMHKTSKIKVSSRRRDLEPESSASHPFHHL